MMMILAKMTTTTIDNTRQMELESIVSVLAKQQSM